jgi:hypothetical protein
MSRSTTDGRGINEVIAVEHENAFSTFCAASAETLTASKACSTTTGYRFCVTDLILYAPSAATFTLLENTTTTKLVWTLAAGGEKEFNFAVPIMFATGAAVHISIDQTNASAYIGGYFKK